MLPGTVAGSPEALRHVMGHFSSGVTIVTALRDGVRHGMTATAVCSVSLEPPLVLVCVSKQSRFHPAIGEAEASGAPRLDGALAWLECTTYAQYDGGDHTIVVGQVVRASGWAAHDDQNSPTPLTYYRGTYSPSV